MVEKPSNRTQLAPGESDTIALVSLIANGDVRHALGVLGLRVAFVQGRVPAPRDIFILLRAPTMGVLRRLEFSHPSLVHQTIRRLGFQLVDQLH